jgi:predicted dehydrogenase
MARAVLAAGLPVFCEKPLAADEAEALAVLRDAEAAGLPFGMAYTYLGYPLVHEARALVASGAIGSLRRIAVSYTQGWLAKREELIGNPQAVWRTDPARSGMSGCLADIGVHAQSLSDFITGDPIDRVSADVRKTLPGRLLDDDAAVLFRTASDVPGTLVVSQVCAGDENRLEISVMGSEGSLRWHQESPNELHLTRNTGITTIRTSAAALTDPVASSLCRLPGGHPEGLIEALGNLYRGFAQRLAPIAPDAPEIPMPDVHDGARSIAFVAAALQSSAAGGAWQQVAPLSDQGKLDV